ncbi:MAG: hypothetical protein LPK09_06400, partial [Hymenobacteraceae bacterium]|nr:hypothetical protein [Hymenobacteraceae bacterium]
MLFIHLSSLAFVSFLPVASAGVVIKKVCLRQQGQTRVSSSVSGTVEFQRLLAIEAESDEKPESEAEVRLCQAKLFYTPATTTTNLNRLHNLYL